MGGKSNMITYEARTTPEAIEFIMDNFKRIGTLQKITHERNIREMDYRTVFHGTSDKISINGGITSGYIGAGPDAFYNLLISLGVSEEIAKQEVYGIKETVYQFAIKF